MTNISFALVQFARLAGEPLDRVNRADLVAKLREIVLLLEDEGEPVEGEVLRMLPEDLRRACLLSFCLTMIECLGTVRSVKRPHYRVRGGA
jgi:hypothetical protein